MTRPEVLKAGISKAGKSIRLSRSRASGFSHRRWQYVIEVFDGSRTVMTWASSDAAQAEGQYQALLEDRLLSRSRKARAA